MAVKRDKGPPPLAFVREGDGGGATTVETPQTTSGSLWHARRWRMRMHERHQNMIKTHLELAFVHEGGGGRVLTRCHRVEVRCEP